MLEVQVSKTRRISSDSLNYIIQAKGKKENGEDYWYDKFFYPNFDCLVEEFVEEEVMQFNSKSLQEVSDEIKALKKFILKRLKEYDNKI